MEATLAPEVKDLVASLPLVIPVQRASEILKIGKNQTYEQINDGTYPIRVLKQSGRFKVSKFDLLHYLGVPGY